MKKYLFLLGNIFVFNLSYGQKSNSTLIPYNQNHKWGFASVKGDIIIKPIFDSVGLFDEGFAEAYDGEKVGLIDVKGKWVVPPKYRTVRVLDSKRKLFEVSIEVIDNDSSSWFPKGIYQQNTGLLTPFNFYSFRAYNSHSYALEGRDEKNYLLDLRSKKIIKLKHKHFFECGCERAYRKQELENEYYIKYLKTRPPLEELNQLYLFQSNSKVGGYTVFDTVFNTKTKKWIKYADTIPAIYDTIQNVDYYDNQLFYVKQNEKWGVVNAKGEKLIEASFDTISKKSFEDCFLVKSDNKYGVYTTKGKVIFDCKYEKVILPCGSNRLSLGKINGKWFVKNTNGQFVSSISYDTIVTNCYEGNDYLIKVKEGNKFGILDTSGKLIYPIIYDELNLRDTFLIYNLKNVYGVKHIRTNADVIKGEWDLIYYRYGNFFVVKKNGKFGVVFPAGYKSKREYFPLANTDDIGIERLGTSKGEADFILFGVYQDGKFFYLGENGIRFTDY